MTLGSIVFCHSYKVGMRKGRGLLSVQGPGDVCSTAACRRVEGNFHLPRQDLILSYVMPTFINLLLSPLLFQLTALMSPFGFNAKHGLHT